MILITGSSGFIGSNCMFYLQKQGYNVIGVDNKIPEKDFGLNYLQHDLRDNLDKIFTTYDINLIIHLAGLKAVEESVKDPLLYYSNNLEGTLNLLRTAKKYGIKKLIFSSSATVYGIPQYLPLDEVHPTGTNISNPYGKTKYMIEEILKDLVTSDPTWTITILRYFNPCGTGWVYEQESSANLFPSILRAFKYNQPFDIYGVDYDTSDGTCVRDYIHIKDLVEGHVSALNNMKDGLNIYNLGTGIGYSVLDVITTIQKMLGKKLNIKMKPPRNGDLPMLVCNPTLANQKLKWRAKRTLSDMCNIKEQLKC
jgi:UDP-glucose 4-epimerase